MDLVETLASAFRYLSKESCKELAANTQLVDVPGGTLLLQEGEESDALYVTVQGRLKVCRNIFKENEQVIAEIGVGEVVGEMGVLSEGKRTASVLAIRDSIVAKLSRDSFRKVALAGPQMLLDFTKNCIGRLTSKVENKSSPLKTLAFFPAGEAAISQEFMTKLLYVLEQKGKVLHIHSQREIQTTKWLLEQEELYAYIVYEGSGEQNTWNAFILRHADRIFFVGDEKNVPHLNPLEKRFFAEKSFIDADLVILHPKNTAATTSLHKAIQARYIQHCHHIYALSFQDIERFIRLVSGKAIGLVLSGGGARALTHIGLIRALEERKIPIDYVGGTSMGAALAAGLALGMNYQAIYQAIKEGVVPAVMKWDYTMPLLSFRSGKEITKACQNLLGETFYIEDCKINFFCIATNLSKHCIEVIDTGLLWKAVRTSLSLPAILPPIIEEKGDLLVDGAMLNNLPVDIMLSRLHGGSIIAGSVSPSQHPKYHSLPPFLSGWELLMKNAMNRAQNIPHIGNIIMSSLMLGSEHHQIQMEEKADFCIRYPLCDIDLLAFNKYDEIIQLGYEIALAKLDVFFGKTSQPF